VICFSHTLTVLAKDGGTNPQKNTATATYTVILTDVNDEDPTILGTPYDETILENTPVNTIVFTLDVQDNDVNQNAVLTFAFTGGNTDGDFVIDSGSGLIQVKNVLDRERTEVYELVVQVTDGGVPARSASVTATLTVADVNDSPPVFQPDPTDTYHFNVQENMPAGSAVGQIVATDDDINNNGQIQYTIAYHIRGNSTHFSLHAGTGHIKVAQSLDRETQDLYVFVVRATDSPTSGDRLTATATVSVTVTDFNDNTPSFSRVLYTASTTENLPEGTSILTVVIADNDVDVNDDITLSISDTTADFYITANSSNYILYVKNPIDREAIDLLNFTLMATDGGTPPLSFTTQVQITVGDENDNAPVFSPVFYNSEIAYNDECQVTVAVLSASDEDQGVNAEFTFATTVNNNPHIFALNSLTGG